MVVDPGRFLPETGKNRPVSYETIPRNEQAGRLEKEKHEMVYSMCKNYGIMTK